MAARSRRGSWAGNLLLVAVSLAIALIAAEVLLRAFWPQDYDVHPRGMYTADPSVGYVLTPGFSGTFAREEYRHPVTIGASGLRGEDPRPRTAETFRIVCIGDSFTWGQGVGDTQTFPYLLEQRLAERYPGVDIQVLNAGVPGYGTADQLRLFESRGERLDPDLVIVQFLAENDFDENRVPALDRVELRDGWLYSAEAPRPQPLRTLDWVKRQSYLARLLSERAGYLATRLGLTTAHGVGKQLSDADAALAMDLLRRMADVARSLGAESVFVFATAQATVLAGSETPVPASGVVAQAARDAGAGFIDLTPLLRARADRASLYYAMDGHWTAAANAAVAEILAGYVDERQGSAIRERARR